MFRKTGFLFLFLLLVFGIAFARPVFSDDAKVLDLVDRAAEAKAREQSTANKMLGAASIGATGMGGMQYMQGMAEKSADEEAAADVKAYTATINCSVSGVGGRVMHGATGTAPAFSAEAIRLKSEFIALAERTRAAKETLGMKPGIESEAIIDKSSLHDHDDFDIARVTRFDTAQERLDSGDAAARMKRGQNLALGGIIGGVVGNLIINEIFPKLGRGDVDKYRAEYQRRFGLPICNDKNNLSDECRQFRQKMNALRTLSDKQLEEIWNKI